MNNYPTLPSLTFSIYRTKDLTDKTHIPGLAGQIFKDIKQSYTGGNVDMYIPKLEEGEKAFGYDVNSLFPSMKDKWDMLIGNPLAVGRNN